MRITQRAIHLGVQSNLQQSLGRLQKLQEQLSSGRLIGRPSDSPTGTVSALRIRSELRRGEQLARNIDDAEGWLNSTDQAITSQIDIVNRVRSLLLQGINGSSGLDAREAIAVEIEQLRVAAIGVANSTYMGRPIFAGTQGVDHAYDPTTGAYAGDAGQVDRVVAPAVSVRVNVTGPEVFGGPPAGGPELFAVLERIATDLRGDPPDTDALAADLEDLDVAFGRLVGTVASVGARANQVTQMRDQLEQTRIDSTTHLAEVESIDLPETIVKLQMQEVAYQAALGATARMIQPSLLDFLR